jgi:hypothetical protein
MERLSAAHDVVPRSAHGRWPIEYNRANKSTDGVTALLARTVPLIGHPSHIYDIERSRVAQCEKRFSEPLDRLQ